MRKVHLVKGHVVHVYLIESQLAFHICYVKYENTLTCKRISWDSWGNDVFKIFVLFPICIIQKVTILAPK